MQPHQQFLPRGMFGFLIIFCYLLGGLTAVFSGTYPALPTANLEVKDVVPLSILEKLADEQAHYIWRESIARTTGHTRFRS